MKNKSAELDVDFIGGERPLTKEDEVSISNFIQSQKVKRARKHPAIKRTVKSTRKKIVA